MKTDNFHEALFNKLIKDPEFKQEYELFSLKLKLAEELKATRIRSKATLEEVAVKMKTSVSALSRLESAQTKSNPTVETIENYLTSLGHHLEFRIVDNNKKSKRTKWISA